MKLWKKVLSIYKTTWNQVLGQGAEIATRWGTRRASPQSPSQASANCKHLQIVCCCDQTVKNSYMQPASKQIVVPCRKLVQTTSSMAKWSAPALLKEGGQCSHVPTGTWQLKSNVPRVWCLSKHQCHLKSKGGLRCAGLEWGTQRKQLGEWEK